MSNVKTIVARLTFAPAHDEIVVDATKTASDDMLALSLSGKLAS
jgi:hypothetical protein